MNQVQKGISVDTWDLMPSTPFDIAVSNCLMDVTSFLGLTIFGQWVLRENVKG